MFKCLNGGRFRERKLRMVVTRKDSDYEMTKAGAFWFLQVRSVNNYWQCLIIGLNSWFQEYKVQTIVKAEKNCDNIIQKR